MVVGRQLMGVQSYVTKRSDQILGSLSVPKLICSFKINLTIAGGYFGKIFLTKRSVLYLVLL